jgi:hypothetical protein
MLTYAAQMLSALSIRDERKGIEQVCDCLV